MTSDPVMIDPDQQRLVLNAIINSPRPRQTLRVWGLAMAHIQRDTGAITASVHELAEDAGTTPEEVAQAVNQLVVIGALLKLGPDRYAINPHIGWVGDLKTRQEAAKDVPPVRHTGHMAMRRCGYGGKSPHSGPNWRGHGGDG